MKINRIENNKINTQKFAPRQKQSATKEYATKIFEKTPNNPLYYQAINNISFTSYFIAAPRKNKQDEIHSLRLYIPFDDGDTITLDLDKNDSIELFINENGTLDSEALDFFTEKYLSFYEIRKAQYKEEKTILLDILNSKEKTNIFVLNPEEEIKRALKKTSTTGDESYAQSLINELYDSESKKTFAAMYLNRIEREFKESTLTTAKEALNIMKLYQRLNYKLNEGDNEKINSIAILITTYNNIAKGDYFDEICDSSIDNEGNFDLDFCLMLCQLLQAGAIWEEPNNDIESAKKIIQSCKIKNPYDIQQTIASIVNKLHEGEINLHNIV